MHYFNIENLSVRQNRTSWKKKIWLSLVGSVLCGLLSGCNNQMAYEFASAETDRTVYSQLSETINPVQFLAMGFVLYAGKFVFVISAFSIILGLIVVFSVKNSPRIKKNAITGLIVGVPLIMSCLYILAKMISGSAGI